MSGVTPETSAREDERLAAFDRAFKHVPLRLYDEDLKPAEHELGLLLSELATARVELSEVHQKRDEEAAVSVCALIKVRRELAALEAKFATARQALREIADEAVNRRTEAPLTKIHAIAVTWDSTRDLNEDGPALAAEEEMIRLQAELATALQENERLRKSLDHLGVAVLTDLQNDPEAELVVVRRQLAEAHHLLRESLGWMEGVEPKPAPPFLATVRAVLDAGQNV